MSLLLCILLSLLYKSCTLVVPFMPTYLFPVCFCLSYHLILYIVFVQILTLICSILFAYLLAVFFIVQIHYASSCLVVCFCFVVCFFSFVGRTPELADCATVQPLCSSCELKFPYIFNQKIINWREVTPCKTQKHKGIQPCIQAHLKTGNFDKMFYVDEFCFGIKVILELLLRLDG